MMYRNKKGNVNMLVIAAILFIFLLILYLFGALNGLVAGINSALPEGMQIPLPPESPLLPPPPEAGGAAFTTTIGCENECLSQGYYMGTCMWPSEAFATDINIGGCLIVDTRHCGNPEQCWCYCWNLPEMPPEPTPPEIPPGGPGGTGDGGSYTYDECYAWALVNGKDYSEIGLDWDFWDCDEWAYEYCESLGMRLNRLDWHINCCIWECVEI